MAAGMQHIFRRPLKHNREHLAATEYSTLLNAVNHEGQLPYGSLLSQLPSLRRVYAVSYTHLTLPTTPYV